MINDFVQVYLNKYLENTNNGNARFPNGLVIENRGNNGKLFDIYGKLKPSEPKQKTSISYDG